METKFTKAMTYFNSVIDTSVFGSDEYKKLCALKFRYIQDYSVI